MGSSTLEWWNITSTRVSVCHRRTARGETPRRTTWAARHVTALGVALWLDRVAEWAATLQPQKSREGAADNQQVEPPGTLPLFHRDLPSAANGSEGAERVCTPGEASRRCRLKVRGRP